MTFSTRARREDNIVGEDHDVEVTGSIDRKLGISGCLYFDSFVFKSSQEVRDCITALAGLNKEMVRLENLRLASYDD